jgi:hypothetical protein
VISQILSNLFLHHAFDLWTKPAHPDLPWCRYADDGLVHCRTEQEPDAVKAALQARLAECQLNASHQNTDRLLQDASRRGTYPNVEFDFLGYCFRPRLAMRSSDKKLFCGFNPAVSPSALKAMRTALQVCHYPPGTSKWNKIEHRLFCHITQTWRGKPLTSRETVVELIASTTTKAALTVRCRSIRASILRVSR